MLLINIGDNVSSSAGINRDKVKSGEEWLDYLDQLMEGFETEYGVSPLPAMGHGIYTDGSTQLPSNDKGLQELRDSEENYLKCFLSSMEEMMKSGELTSGEWKGKMELATGKVFLVIAEYARNFRDHKISSVRKKLEPYLDQMMELKPEGIVNLISPG